MVHLDTTMPNVNKVIVKGACSNVSLVQPISPICKRRVFRIFLSDNKLSQVYDMKPAVHASDKDVRIVRTTFNTPDTTSYTHGSDGLFKVPSVPVNDGLVVTTR